MEILSDLPPILKPTLAVHGFGAGRSPMETALLLTNWPNGRPELESSLTPRSQCSRLPFSSASPFFSLSAADLCHVTGLEQIHLDLTFTDGRRPTIEGLLTRLGKLSWATACIDRRVSVRRWCTFSVFPFWIPGPQN